MALESATLTRLESLKLDSIDTWDDMKKAFIDNFHGSIAWALLAFLNVATRRV